MTEEIKSTVINVVEKFVYYDRKEDEDLSVNDLNKSMESGETTVKEIVDLFEKSLKSTYPDS